MSKIGRSDQCEVVVVVFLLLLCFALRWPFLFPAVVDWDESTFILMGQSLLDGHLPYTELWDNKPPLAFAAFAAFIAIFGKAIASIRFAGTLCVFATSYFVYRLGRRIWCPSVGIWAAVFVIVFTSVCPSGQATMSEIVAVVPLIAALLLLGGDWTGRTLFLAGFLVSVATLVRFNLAYVALAIGLVVFIGQLWHRDRPVASLAAFAAGGVLPPIAVCAIYAASGHWDALFASTLKAYLAYAEGQFSPGTVLLRLIRAQAQPTNGLLLMWLGVIGGLVYVLAQWNRWSATQRRGIILLGVCTLAVLFSILAGGTFFPHYLIQLVPLASLFAAAPMGSAFSMAHRRLVFTLTAAALLAANYVVIAKYVSVGRQIIRGESLMSDNTFKLADLLRRENPCRAPMYLMSDHIAYWLTGTKPLTWATTHPSNITKDYLLKAILGQDATPEVEMDRVLAVKPLLVVKTAEPWYLAEKPEVTRILADALAADYALVGEIGELQIYRRRAGPDCD
jgi:4-amino-4-deoxy-L-arabinose transferase-like glycosyltransferase